jgi:hypothetical protein
MVIDPTNCQNSILVLRADHCVLRFHSQGHVWTGPDLRAVEIDPCLVALGLGLRQARQALGVVT